MQAGESGGLATATVVHSGHAMVAFGGEALSTTVGAGDKLVAGSGLGATTDSGVHEDGGQRLGRVARHLAR